METEKQGKSYKRSPNSEGDSNLELVNKNWFQNDQTELERIY